MLTYYVIYRNDDKADPRGLFVMDVERGGALLWNHRRGGWSYDPALVVRFLDDYRNLDRYENVERSVAADLSERITGMALPDEKFFAELLEAGLNEGS